MSDTNEPKYERDKIYTINVSELIPNPQQPRQYFDENEIKALAKSIETDGLLFRQPTRCYFRGKKVTGL